MSRRPARPVSNQTPAERSLIERIRARQGRKSFTGLSLGIGDDCALLEHRPDEQIAVTTDLSIQDRHFRLEWHPPESVGHRALARGLSDLAAMGARPLAAFLSLGLPRELAGRANPKASNSWMSRFLDGLLGLAGQYGVPLAGGDLAESPLAVADIVLAGAVPRGQALLRSGARPGDMLFVTGTLGGAAAALERLANGGNGRGPDAARHAPDKAPELVPQLFPQPRIAQGIALRRRGLATAAIDLSDGLSSDLAHLCEESGVAAQVDAALLPVHPGATLTQALHGGEDYELLFAARPHSKVPRKIAGVKITRIGRVMDWRRGRSAVTLMDGNRRIELTPGGWEHFS